MRQHKSIIVAAAGSGSGKTTITTGLIRHIKNQGKDVAPFKCGPDYIDTLHLSTAAGRNAGNLDSVMLNENILKKIFYQNSGSSDFSVIEGAMGIFDGIDPLTFKGSSYDIAKIINSPILLVLDCSGMSFSVAAICHGIKSLGSDAKFAGVVLNNVASVKHENLVSQAIKAHGRIDILGAVPRGAELLLPSRHLGIKTAVESDDEYFESCAGLVSKHIDTEKLFQTANCDIEILKTNMECKKNRKAYVAYDKAFQFYYDENIIELENCGYEIIKFSPLKNETVDDADFVYIGGGYPELYAGELSDNKKTMGSIKSYAENGGKLYAECGGLMYLSSSITNEEKKYEMTGLYNAETEMTKRRQALGYVKETLLKDCVAGRKGESSIGHEFHYSKISKYDGEYTCELTGLTDGVKRPDGLVYKNCFASYTHLHFLTENCIAKNIYGENL